MVLFSEITCGRWLDDRRLVFDRVADMPATVTLDEEEPSQQVPADTTTVAVLDPPRLVDSPERWRLEDRCGDQVLTFVDDHNPPLLDPDTVVFNLETGGSTFMSSTGLVGMVLGWLPS